MIYFDYAAASLVRKEVLDSFIMACQDFANPNSNHILGRKANEKIQDTTKKIADLLGVLPDEIIYTSGSTESNNLVVKGILERYKNFGKHILVSSLEHSSILSPLTYMSEKGFEIEVVPVNEEGIITPLEIEKRLRSDTILVSVTAMDSELGIIEPIDEIGKMLKKYPHTYFHTDATQIIGKEPFNLANVDLATISAHKLSGLDGTSILIKKESAFSVVVSSLCEMGYDRIAVEKTVAKIAADFSKEADFSAKTQAEKEDSVFKKAIMEMAR